MSTLYSYLYVFVPSCLQHTLHSHFPSVFFFVQMMMALEYQDPKASKPRPEPANDATKDEDAEGAGRGAAAEGAARASKRSRVEGEEGEAGAAADAGGTEGGLNVAKEKDTEKEERRKEAPKSARLVVDPSDYKAKCYSGLGVKPKGEEVIVSQLQALYAVGVSPVVQSNLGTSSVWVVAGGAAGLLRFKRLESSPDGEENGKKKKKKALRAKAPGQETPSGSKRKSVTVVVMEADTPAAADRDLDDGPDFEAANDIQDA